MVKNNKGFMLIEVIITSTIVLTAMVFLYSSFNKIYNSYRTKNNYYNIDATYATKALVNTLIEEDLINKLINDKITTNHFEYIINQKQCEINSLKAKYQNIQNLYNIENVIFSEYNINNLLEIKKNSSKLNQTFKEYIDYLITTYEPANELNNYSYIVLTEIKEGNNYYYANLKIR